MIQMCRCWTLLFVINLVSTHVLGQDLLLFDAQKTYYNISTAHNTRAEKDAAVKLKKFLQQQSEKSWKIETTTQQSQKNLIIISTIGKGLANEERCDIYVQGNQLHIDANEQLLSTAISFFLENFTGCRQYSDEVIFVPSLQRCTIPKNYRQSFKPAFPIRLLYDRSAFDSSFISWHGLSNKPGRLDNNKRLGWGLWVHTFFDLIPPEKYFSSHPEYFSLRNGRRVPRQLCLSNKAVLDLAIANLASFMKKRDVKYWSVSQNDNEEYCQCDNCQAIANREKSESGPILRFVNAIAAKYPDKIITTLAYQYSRKAPAVTKASGNVGVVLCSYESDRSVPLNDSRQKDGFSSDLKDWLTRCNNMMVWDYSINLSAIPGPYPNLHVLQPNLQYLQQAGVKMVFEQGWPFNGGGMQEYRAYLLAKLLWNPWLNVDSLKQDFFNHYYGNAGPTLLRLVDLMQQEFEQSGKLLSIYENLDEHRDGFLSVDLRDRYQQLINEAFGKVANMPQFWTRVDVFAQAFRFADIETNWFAAGRKEWIDKYGIDKRIAWKNSNDSLLSVFTDKTKKYGPPTMRENMMSIPEWKNTRSQRFFVDAEVNKALHADISFKNAYVPDFAGSGPQALVDGSFGTDDWSRTWQGWASTDIVANLKFAGPVSFLNFQMRFMKDPDYDLQPPVRVMVQASHDGIHFNKVFEIKQQPTAGKKKEVVVFEQTLSHPITARYLQVVAFWRGRDASGKGSYLFADEIFIK